MLFGAIENVTCIHLGLLIGGKKVFVSQLPLSHEAYFTKFKADLPFRHGLVGGVWKCIFSQADCRLVGG